ncbi:MAG: MotA/TolQ/ExbB proton channel family protein [Planctomycetota bacterium]
MSARAAMLIALAALALGASPVQAQERAAPAPAAGATPAPSPSPQQPEQAAGADALRRAYEKEYAFLGAEEAALRGRLDEVAADRGKRLGALQAELDELQRRLNAAHQAAAQRREQLTKLEADLARQGEAGDALGAVLSQVESLRRRHGRPALPAEGEPSARLARALADVGLLLRAQASLRGDEGSFFLPDGSESRGRLLRVGAVAALGVSPRGGGALAPAGDGQLQLWDAATRGAAERALDRELPEVLPLYVYEGLDKRAERAAERSFAQLVEKGGVIAYVIVVLGAVAALLLLLRVVILGHAAGDPERLLARVEPALARGDLEGALAASAGRGAAARALQAMLPHVRSGGSALESAASEHLLQATARLDRFETAVLVAAAVAPLLGLLGTVTGMISTFDVITVHGTGDPKLLSGGISEALITTQLGLTVAIPALLLGNLLSGWASGLRDGCERVALRLAILCERAPLQQAAEAAA